MTGPTQDVVIIGGGHNGLAAAAYLARAGLRTQVLERLDHTGGAAISADSFPGTGVRLSRYSYLVALLPERIARELDLDVELRSRATASYSPTIREGRAIGLYVEQAPGDATRESFRALTGSDDEFDAWRAFYEDVSGFAGVLAPTLTEPLPREEWLTGQIDPRTWRELVEEPLGRAVEARLHDDLVRGVVATDALIGTFASLHDPSLVQNRCFLYHLIGNGTGEWRVPVGGMGAVTDGLARAAVRAGAQLHTDAEVIGLEPSTTGSTVTWRDPDGLHTTHARHVLANVAPFVLAALIGDDTPPPVRPEGAQLKINFLLGRLPRLRSGMDPRTAFAGTLHIAEEYDALERAHDQARTRIPDLPPGEFYCHSLTDESILGPLAGTGAHTLTYFGLHMPARLFAADAAGTKEAAVARAIAAIDQHLDEPLMDCVLTGPDGRACIEAKIPQEIEEDLNMPGGHIFHGDLSWPWASSGADLSTPAARWGVQTPWPSVTLCGSGSRRGGAVSALGGHHAAHAVLEERS